MIQRLTVQFLQAQIVVKRLQSHQCIDGFSDATSEREKTLNAFLFACLDKQADLLEYALFLLDFKGENV